MSPLYPGAKRSSFTGASGTATAARKGVCRNRVSIIGNLSLTNNRERDRRKEEQLRSLGWSVLVIWQCETADLEALTLRLQDFMDDKGVRSVPGVNRGSIGSHAGDERGPEP